jgi:predicted ester cyclase
MGRAADVVRAKIAAFNAQDPDEIHKLLSPEVEWAVPGDLLEGPEQVAAFHAVLWEAFPDLTLTVILLVEEGSSVLMQGRSEGTHLGTFHTPGGDIPATGRRVDLTYSEYFEVEAGQIVAVRLIFDRLELLEQLGVAPAPASA